MYKYTHLYGHVKRKRMITVRQLCVAIGVSGSAEWFISSLRAFGQAVGQISRVVHVSVRAPFVSSHAYAWICMDMHTYTCCMHMHAYACFCMHMHAYACICMHMHAYAYICIDIHAYPYMCMHRHAYAGICMHMHAYACRGMNMHIHEYACLWVLHFYRHGYACICIHHFYRQLAGSLLNLTHL